jgi:general secretion pathway protein J
MNNSQWVDDFVRSPISPNRFIPRQCGGLDPGFTLLEITVAIFIFALVITTVFGSFRAVFSSADAVGGDVGTFATARTCLGRMATDLAALQVTQYPRYEAPEFNDPPDPYRVVGDVTDLSGTPFGRLRFASSAHLALNRDPRKGVCRIVYYVHPKNDDTLVLRRADHLYPFPEFEENEDDPILCDNVQALEFGYLDADGEMNESWDSDAADTDYATPRAVEVRLTVGTQDRSRTFTTRIALYVFREAKE